MLDTSLYDAAKDLTDQMDEKFQDYCEENDLEPNRHELFAHIQQCVAAFEGLGEALMAYNKHKEESYMESAKRKRKVSPVPLGTAESPAKKFNASTITIKRPVAFRRDHFIPAEEPMSAER